MVEERVVLEKLDRPAGARLLEHADSGRKNDSGDSIVSWFRTNGGIGGIFNPKGWAMLRVVLWKLVRSGGLSARSALYDQPLLVENAGVYVVCRVGARWGLVRQFRMIGDRHILPDANRDFVRLLNERSLWGRYVESLGRWSWEVPAGLVDAPQGIPEEQALLEAARNEVRQEAGFHLLGLRVVGKINANPVHFVNTQYVVLANIEGERHARPQPTEVIGQQRLFTQEEIQELVRTGELCDARTIAALALCGVSFI